jgi:hypothetical protein
MRRGATWRNRIVNRAERTQLKGGAMCFARHADATAKVRKDAEDRFFSHFSAFVRRVSAPPRLHFSGRFTQRNEPNSKPTQNAVSKQLAGKTSLLRARG